MRQPDTGQVTRWLAAARDGDPAALGELLPLVYEDLRRMARAQLRRERAPRTLQPTALVHESYLKLASGGVLRATDREHFLAIAAHAMRQVLVDEARRRGAARRGGGWARTTLGDEPWDSGVAPDELLTLSDAIDQLEERQRQVVEYRYFGGLEEREIATLLGVTERTVRRDWVKARAWLYAALYEPDSPSAAGGGERPTGSPGG